MTYTYVLKVMSNPLLFRLKKGSRKSLTASDLVGMAAERTRMDSPTERVSAYLPTS